jgi:hypothetical protein
MSNLDQLLEPTGLKFEELTQDEQTEALSMLEILNSSKVTIEGIRKSIEEMKYSVEDKLAVAELTPEQDLFLKARLRNYMLLETLIGSHSKAKEAVQTQLKEVLRNKSK